MLVDETDAERVERDESDLNMVADLCRYSEMRVCADTLVLLIVQSLINCELWLKSEPR